MKTITPVSLFAPLAPAAWKQPNQTTFWARDLADPWCSVYGFPLIAIQLAAGQKLLLVCREDEVFELLAKLNTLLACPTALNRAYKLGRRFEQAVQSKIEWLCKRRKQAITNAPQAGQPEPVTASEKTGVDSFSQIIAPNDPVQKIAGLKQIQSRLEVWLPALNIVKDRGFHSIALDRRRQPSRPALELYRNEPILLDGEPSPFEAGFLQPIQYHLTLWAYLVGRSECGQSPIWS